MFTAYSPVHKCWPKTPWAGNQGSFDPFFLNLWLIFMELSSEMADSKKTTFLYLKRQFSVFFREIKRTWSLSQQNYLMTIILVYTLMPFVSIDPTDPRTNPAQFCKTISRNDCCEKHFFLSGPFWQFFSKIPWKAVKCSLVARMGQFFCLPWFPAHEVLGQHLWTGM